jgi:hypothetical protein
MNQATATPYATGAGVGSVDRWFPDWSTAAPTAFTLSRQAFTTGQTAVPNNPTYFARWAITTIGTATNLRLTQNVEDVRMLAGKTVTFSFWGANTVAVVPVVKVNQSFGTGGSPSGVVATTCSTLPAMSASWAKYTSVCVVPSIAGKTIGTNENSFTGIQIFPTAVNQQFDIAQAMLNDGPTAAPFVTAGKFAGAELALAQRFCQTNFHGAGCSSLGATGGHYCFLAHKVSMRANPVLFAPFFAAATKTNAIFVDGSATYTPTGQTLHDYSKGYSVVAFSGYTSTAQNSARLVVELVALDAELY